MAAGAAAATNSAGLADAPQPGGAQAQPGGSPPGAPPAGGPPGGGAHADEEERHNLAAAKDGAKVGRRAACPAHPRRSGRGSLEGALLMPVSGAALVRQQTLAGCADGGASQGRKQAV